MATKATTVRIELAVRKQAEDMLEEIGMDLNTYLVASVKALVREKRVPFEMATAEYIADQAALKKSIESSRPLTFVPPAQVEHPQYTTAHMPPEILAEAERKAYPTPIEVLIPVPTPTPQQYTTANAEPELPEEAKREVFSPIEMVTSQQYSTDLATLEKLAQAQREAGDPNTELLSHKKIFDKIRERHANEI